MLLRKGFRCFALLLSCLVLSSCAGKNNYDRESEKSSSVMQEKSISISDEEFTEIREFMNCFMIFPVIWDFDQQNISGAVDYFAQKWVWTDVSDLEYDAENKAFYVLTSDFTEKMGQYFVLSDDALRQIEGKAWQGKIKICADMELSWGFSFGIDRVEERYGAYFVHGCNTEVMEKFSRMGDEFIMGGNADPFFEFNAVIVRNEKDGKLRLRELNGLKNGPGRKANVLEVSDTMKRELADFLKVFAEGSVLESFDINDLTDTFDFAAQKILNTNPEAVRVLDDGRCVVSFSELKDFMDRYFYLPKGYEKCLPEEGKGIYPCLSKEGVIFLKNENAIGFELRTDPPVVQNDQFYFYGAYNMDAEALREKLTAEGKDLSVIKDLYPFELVVIKAIRGVDGKLRLLYFKSHYL